MATKKTSTASTETETTANVTYTITLADGTTLDNLGMNGTNYVSETEVDTSIFTDSNLAKVTISDGTNTDEYENLVFIQQMKWQDGTYYLAFRKQTEREKIVKIITDNSSSLVDVQEAIAELYELTASVSEQNRGIIDYGINRNY